MALRVAVFWKAALSFIRVVKAPRRTLLLPYYAITQYNILKKGVQQTQVVFVKGSSREKEEYAIEFEEAKWRACTVGEAPRNAISFNGIDHERKVV
jgi:hypothetical protein